MRHFPIKELERLSGIKAHTIRIWELRYTVFAPQRTESNVRYYSIDDLEYLLNIALLLQNGHRISKLAELSKSQLETEILSLTGADYQRQKVINRLVVYMFWENILDFEYLLDEYLQVWGIDETIHGIIIPFLDKVNILSYSSSSTDVHFVVTAIRKKLIYGIESVKASVRGQDSALLFLMQGEHYDLILLYINYILKATGVQVLYLGTNISLDNLEKVVAEKKPTMLFSYITSARFNEKVYSNAIRHYLPHTKLYVVYPLQLHLSKSNSSNIEFWPLDKVGILKETCNITDCSTI